MSEVTRPRAPHGLRLWGLGGAVVAAVFAVWMLFFPAAVTAYFAWPVEPRLGQVFLGAGWIFRTGFFLSVWREPAWHRLRWVFWGNLAFTGTLLLATFLHADRFNWAFPTAVLWVILYVAEPVVMVYLAPHRPETPFAPPEGVCRIGSGLRWLLIAELAILGTVGAWLITNPAFMGGLWPWALRPLGARIIAAWFLGWAVWAGAMAFAQDWDEIRIGVRLNILFGLALLASILVFLPLFDFRQPGVWLYVGGIALLTGALIFFYWRQASPRTPA